MSLQSNPTEDDLVISSRWKQAGKAFVRHKTGMPAAIVLFIVALGAFVGPYLWKFGHKDITPDVSQPPSLTYPFGTDSLGHDMLALVMRGTQVSLLIAISVALVATILGVAMGLVAGFRGGVSDAIIMRSVDLVLTIPSIALAAFLGQKASDIGAGWVGIAIVLGLLLWTTVSRVVRSVTLTLRELPYIDAARVMGVKEHSILFRHLIPNTMGPILVATTILVAVAILAESSLSFIGFGVRPPDVSLGLLVSNAQSAIVTRPWMFYIPGSMIIVIVLAINFVGDGLRDAFDPRPVSGSFLSPKRSRRGQNSASRQLFEVPPCEPRAHRSVLRVERLTVEFATSREHITAVKDVSFDIGSNEVVALVGESGSGKSVTSLTITGLLPDTAKTRGRVRFRDFDVTDLSYQDWLPLRGKRIATILQDPSTALNPVLTIGSQFRELVAASRKVTVEESDNIAAELLSSVGINEPHERLRQYPHQMSGGMRQRIVIAMAMVNSPDLIIADEPTTALDVTVQKQVLVALSRARQITGASMLFITHNLAVVAGIADRVLVMKDGELVEERTVEDLFDSPEHSYTRRLLAAIPQLPQANDQEDSR